MAANFVEPISFTFLILSCGIGLPVSMFILFASLDLAKGIGKTFTLVLAGLGLAFAICTFSLAVCGSYFSRWDTRQHPYYGYTIWEINLSIYSIVSMVMGCIGLPITIASFAVYMPVSTLQKRGIKPNKIKVKSHKNSSANYIEEIKQLKELLDCEAITKEEYDFKKSEVLGNR